ncbi:MAG TPA: chloride channel protein [Thermoanaerobaculia bacterium]|nr:chloride channel protein [Thermoanaerobaculia bacterium]
MISRSPLRPAVPPTYRVLGACLAVGLLGAVAALAFEAAVTLAQRLLLQGITGYVPPRVGVLDPVVALPEWSQRWWLPVALGLGGLLSGWLVFTLAPEAEGHGTDAAVGAYHRHAGEVRTRIPFIKGLASAITIGSGGVAGREGPTAQISVGLGAILARMLRLRGGERRILLLAGMSAGLAAIFRAPLGMAIFAVEILYSGMVFESEALLYTVISAVTAYAIHGFFAGWSPIFAIPRGLAFDHPATLLGFAALGLLAGVFGAVLPTLFYRVRDFFLRLPGPRHVKPALGGVLAGLIGMAAPQILGTGYGWVELAMAGKLSMAVLLTILLLKAPAMSLTIGSGGSGGVFAPTVTLGAMLGGVVGLLLQGALPQLGVVPAAFVVVGMAAIFSGAARTPLSTLIMVAEMTGGYRLIVPAMLANILAFLVQSRLTAGWRYPTLYESQVPTREDSPVHRGLFVRRALELLEGGELDRSEVTLPRLVSLLRFGHPIPITHRGGMLVTVEIAPGSALDGQTVAGGLGRMDGATAVAVLRGEEMLVPRGPTQLARGDQLIAVATAEGHEHLRELASAGPESIPGS